MLLLVVVVLLTLRLWRLLHSKWRANADRLSRKQGCTNHTVRIQHASRITYRKDRLLLLWYHGLGRLQLAPLMPSYQRNLVAGKHIPRMGISPASGVVGMPLCPCVCCLDDGPSPDIGLVRGTVGDR